MSEITSSLTQTSLQFGSFFVSALQCQIASLPHLDIQGCVPGCNVHRGIYVVRHWWEGHWQCTVVDDLMPCRHLLTYRWPFHRM